MRQDVILESELTCTERGHHKLEIMPTDAWQWFYECDNCHTLLKPSPETAACSVLTGRYLAHRSTLIVPVVAVKMDDLQNLHEPDSRS